MTRSCCGGRGCRTVKRGNTAWLGNTAGWGMMHYRRIVNSQGGQWAHRYDEEEQAHLTLRLWRGITPSTVPPRSRVSVAERSHSIAKSPVHPPALHSAVALTAALAGVGIVGGGRLHV